MTKLEIQFLEEFKKLENSCNERYDCEHGVSFYIEKMEDIGDAGKEMFDNWTSNYKALKNFRWMRNKIVHEEGSVEVKPEDIRNIKTFLKHFHNLEDPVSLYYDRRSKHKSELNAEEIDKRNKTIMFGIILAIVIFAALFLGK